MYSRGLANIDINLKTPDEGLRFKKEMQCLLRKLTTLTAVDVIALSPSEIFAGMFAKVKLFFQRERQIYLGGRHPVSCCHNSCINVVEFMCGKSDIHFVQCF